MNFFIADVQTGFGTFVAFYLAHLGWSPAGVGLVQGATLTMQSGSAAPAGFTKIGTTSFPYRDVNGIGRQVWLDVYQKN